MAHVPDPENEAQFAVTLAHHRVLGEHQGLRPLLRPGQLGEDRAHLQMGTHHRSLAGSFHATTGWGRVKLMVLSQYALCSESDGFSKQRGRET